MDLKVFVEDESKFQQLLEKELEKDLSSIGSKENEETVEEREHRETMRIIGMPGFEENYDQPNFTMQSVNSVELSKQSCFLAKLNIPISEIKSVYVDEVNRIQKEVVMIINTAHNQTYNCLFEKSKFKLIIEYIRMIDSVTIESLYSTYEMIKGNIKENGNKLPTTDTKNSSEKEVIVPMGTMDTNKN